MANFNEIEEARKLLGLGEAATLKEIKRAYRTLAHRYHPDKHSNSVGEGAAETMKRLNWAYKLLMDYCDNYTNITLVRRMLPEPTSMMSI
jgi:DnaJ-class molecular chaperone